MTLNKQWTLINAENQINLPVKTCYIMDIPTTSISEWKYLKNFNTYQKISNKLLKVILAIR